MATETRTEHLYDLLKDFDRAMLVSHSADGHMHARPMAVAELRPSADAYFVTRAESPKVAEIAADPNVTLTFQGSRKFATLSGRMSVVRDQSTIDRLWKEDWKLWFPKGKTDPAITLLKFDAEDGEYWDNEGVQGIQYVFEALRAYVKGEMPKSTQEQNAKVNL